MSAVDVTKVLGKDRLVTNIDQIPSEYRKSPKTLVEYVYGELQVPYVYYRRGDSNLCYQEDSNFIPVWAYLLLLNQVILFLNPTKDTVDALGRAVKAIDAFKNYCGMYPKQLLPFIQKGQIIVLLANNENEVYDLNAFGEFFADYPKEKKLMRAQIWEDIYFKEKGEEKTFANKVEDDKQKWLSLIDQLPGPHKTQYFELAKSNVLMPKGSDIKNTLDKLAGFIAEKGLWQEIKGIGENIEKIEKALKDKRPLSEVYDLSHSYHYLVAHDIYARGGFTALARDEDMHIVRYLEGIPALQTFQTEHPNLQSRRISSVLLGQGLLFPYPKDRSDESIQKALDMLLEIQEHSKLGPLRKKIIESVAKFSKVSQFHSDMEVINQRVEKIKNLIDSKKEFNEEMENFLKKKTSEELLLKDCELGMIVSKPSLSIVKEKLNKLDWRDLPRIFPLVIVKFLHLDTVAELIQYFSGEASKDELKRYADLICQNFDGLKFDLLKDLYEAPSILVNYPNPKKIQ